MQRISSKGGCWDRIVDKIERRLSQWKGNLLSIGGLLILLKVVLSSLPAYFLGVFKCPIAVIEKLERIQRQFLWNDGSERRKFHLISWSQVCKLKKDGGLGIPPIRQFNVALLRKWLWRLKGYYSSQV